MLWFSVCSSLVLTLFQDPARIAQERAYAIQGEYVSEVVFDPGKEPEKVGLQVLALGGERFGFVAFRGGLPGDGGNLAERTVTLGTLNDDVITLSRSQPDTVRVGEGTLSAEVDGDPFVLKKVERKSRTLGAKPPEGARVLFDGQGTDAWVNGAIDDEGCLKTGTRTREEFGAFELHLEFRVPFKPAAALGGQDRGNSGVYVFDRYEVQVLDSYGLHYAELAKPDAWRATFEEEWRVKPGSDRKQWCGALYGRRTPSTNACYPPGAWQTYDIEFQPPVFDGERKTQNARITVRHNGIVIHDDVELPRGTGAGGGRKEVAQGGISLQAHGNPVQFRNVWIVTK
ncbi:MAG: DUF1080 domain-containing protein [Planctomycetes bacterium]|nr:DUF1080 domain-containing protein [Planctomycetota bacterium]